MSCNRHHAEKEDSEVQVNKIPVFKQNSKKRTLRTLSLIQTIIHWFYKPVKYHCYKCNKMKVKNKFGKCTKPHVMKVRGTDINFSCLQCDKVFQN